MVFSLLHSPFSAQFKALTYLYLGSVIRPWSEQHAVYWSFYSLSSHLAPRKSASRLLQSFIVWLGMLAAFGIYNLAVYDWHVLKAFNPAEGFLYLIRNGKEGWKSLGGILLAFTGVETLFADLGAFSKRAIQMSWLSWCLPCLLLAYIGQAAYISVHPAAYAYPVFHTCPPHMLVPIMVVAVLAAVVASQAIIVSISLIK